MFKFSEILRSSQRFYKQVQKIAHKELQLSLLLHIWHYLTSSHNSLEFNHSTQPLAQFPVIILQGAQAIYTELNMGERKSIETSTTRHQLSVIISFIVASTVCAHQWKLSYSVM